MISLQKIGEQLLYDPKNPLLFNSGFFLYFLFFFLLVYYAVRKNKTQRVAVFTAFSLYFFYKACGWFVVLVAVSAVVDFTLSNLIYRQDKSIEILSITVRRTRKSVKKLLLVTSIVLNLGLLFYFKYTNFFVQLLNDLSSANLHPLNLALPIGISFYTFENLSYTIDVYRGEFKPVTSFLDYLFFLSFFPKLMMGPIVRASDFIPQIANPYAVGNADFSRGFYLIAGGLFKKIVVSDYINVNFVQYVFDDPALHNGLECLLAVYGYALVIYCDFSGYSDIAIGLARWTGFTVPANFLSPYQSGSITVFWRRWHISLSSWLRDYLYIPLGGNRKGTMRTYVNLFLTMLLGGFWHGASWNFLIWGGLHGTMLAVDKKIKSRWKPSGLFWKAAGVLFTFHFVCFCWIFFKAKTLADAAVMIKQIFTNFNAATFPALWRGYAGVFYLMLLAFLLHAIPDDWSEKASRRTANWNLAFYVVGFLLFLALCLQVKTAEQVMPVYLQF